MDSGYPAREFQTDVFQPDHKVLQPQFWV
jgi:hypothetical protein